MPFGFQNRAIYQTLKVFDTMKKYCLFLLPIFQFLPCFAQDESPTSSPGIKTFALQPDVTGAASNSVNLFTGDVALPQNLVSLPGRNGLDVNVSIAYSSNVQHQVNLWNLEAPTGILGLGWSMDIPKIVADHKQTGTREDDEYYLVEGGASNRLIRTTSGSDANGSFYAYETKNFQFWKIRYYYDIAELYDNTGYGSGPNKWEITREDGTRYVYGDKNSGRGTVQWAVRWKNWIGNSAQTADQSQLANVWNLSEIINSWNDKVTFTYENVEQFVGSSAGKKHTEASYLKQITDVMGRKVVFHYKDKNTFVFNGVPSPFWMEPHTERTEPDAYQEIYERNYLDNIEVLREDNSKFLTVELGYTALDAGSTTAMMLLSSVVQKNATGLAMPGMQFSYVASGATKGFLQKITYPTGGTVTYGYKTSGNSISRSNRQLTINAPAGYAEPMTWIAEDYVVVAWRALGANNSHDTNPKEVKLYVYQWVGEWKEQFLQTISSVALSGSTSAANLNYNNFQVVTQPKFFAVLSSVTNGSFTLFIRYKDETTASGIK
jgi:hypothetical protein